MTPKEKEKIGTGSGRESSYKMHSKVFAKEMEKYMQKHGFLVTKENFEISNSENDKTFRMKFKDGGVVVATYNWMVTNSIDDWERNGLSLVKTFRQANEFAEDNRDSKEGRTFKSFLENIKSYCHTYGMVDYEEVNKDESDEIEK